VRGAGIPGQPELFEAAVMSGGRGLVTELNNGQTPTPFPVEPPGRGREAQDGASTMPQPSPLSPAAALIITIGKRQ